MAAPNEFVNLIIQNQAPLAETYAQLLAEADEHYAKLENVERVALGRKLLNAVIDTYQTGQNDPLILLFTKRRDAHIQSWPGRLERSNLALELTCLERTLTPIIPNIQDGKYFWQLLAEIQFVVIGITPPKLATEYKSTPQIKSDSKRSVTDGQLTVEQGNGSQVIPAKAEAGRTVVLTPQHPADGQIIGDAQPIKDSLDASSGKEKVNAASEEELPGKSDYSFLLNYYLELSTDSFSGIVIITVILSVFCSMILLLTYPPETIIEFWKNGIYIVISPLLGRLFWQMARNGKQEEGKWLFIGVHIFLLTVNIALVESLDTPLPYLYGYFIVISSTLLRPNESFYVWITSVVLLIAAAIYRGEFLSGLFVFAPAIGFNLFLAIASFFITIDWREAVQSTSILQRRAQRRRDELFEVQEELKRSNNRQKALYTQLVTSVEVGQRITAQLDPDVLLFQIVDLIKRKLEFAYVGIFLLENGRYLRMQSQTGDQLNTNKSIRIFLEENNILNTTAVERQPIINANVRNAVYVSHPYLSTSAQSEIGLPLIVGEDLLGVLNIQSYGVNAFGEANLLILRLLANQAAVALHNAQLFNTAVLARKEAEQANEIKSKFLASMSHELRTPLNAILNFSGFVVDGVFGEVNPEQTDALEKTLDSGSHLLSLINDILDLAKVEAGAMEMFIQEVDMKSLLKSTAAMGKGLLKNKTVDLIVEIDEDLPHLFGDKRRLRQILLNLVSNAVKYTREGNITIKAFQQDGMIQISVKDTGIGINPDEQDLIFESFHQAQNSLSGELGTGLGLPIAKHFVEAHGGKIWIESEIDVGTTFYVQLPLNSKQGEPAPIIV